MRRCVCAGVCVLSVSCAHAALCMFLCMLFPFFSPSCVFVYACFLQVSIKLNLLRFFFLISIPSSSSPSSPFLSLPKNCVPKTKKGERSRNGLEPFHSN